MRKATILAAALLLAGATAGCANSTRGDPAVATAQSHGANPAASVSSSADPVQFAKCMRENGIPDFPDLPTDGSGISLSKLGIDPKSPRFQAAQGKCEDLLPGGNGGTVGN